MQTVLVVDDDPELCDTVCFLLSTSGFRATSVSDGNAMFKRLADGDVDLVILDVGLGDEDGRELVMQLRKDSHIPIIMLTGKGSETDRVVGLELGADDYVTKPYSSAELIARVNAVLRRAVREAPPSAEADFGTVAHFEGWKLDLTRRRLMSPEGAEEALSTGEFDLLAAFVKHPQRVLSREQLLDFTGKEEAYDRSIDVQVMRLRRKVEPRPDQPELIQAVRGVGYTFSAKVKWS